MGLDQAIDITTEQSKIVLGLLERHLPNTTAWVYGSRAKWTSRPQSDLDVVVFATPKQNGRVSDLRQAFEESNLPFRVDLFVWDAVPEQFREHIKQDHVVLIERAERSVTGEWSRNRFDQILIESVRNGIYKKKEFHGRGVKIVNMSELFAHSRLRAVPMRRVEISESEAERFLIAKGDLLFARRSLVAEGAGKCCAVLEVDEPTTFESSIIRARPDKTKAAFLYLYYFFNSLSGLHQLDTIRRQVAVAGITGGDLANLEIPVPPLPEQRAIAHILGTLDDKIELNRRMNETLEGMARALFKSWFVDFDPVRAKMEGRNPGLPRDIADLFPDRLVDSELGEIPEGWEVVALPKMIEVNPARPLKKGERAPYLDMANMPTKGHAPDKVIDRPFGSGMRFTNGDTLVARITPCLENGKTAYVDFLQHGRIGWGSTEYIVMRPKPPLPSELAYCLARSAGFREFAIQNMTGTSGRQRVPAKALSQFLLPSLPKQVAASFGSVVHPLLTRASAAVRESRTLAALRDTLLPKLISGEIRIRYA